MSRWPERWVRLAARLLPTHIRDRHREEWLTDLDGARELGIPASSIAVGALLFTATIDRSAPEISGVPLSVAARIHARRGIALILSAGVLAFGAYFGGTRVSFGSPSTTEAVLSFLASAIPALAVVAAIAGLIELWRAAFFASLLTKVCAALATVGVVSAPLAAIGGWFMVPLAFVSLFAASIVGVIVWAGSSRPAVPHHPTLDGAAPSARPRFPLWARLSALVMGSVIVTVAVVMPGFVALVALPAAMVTVLMLAVYTIRSRAVGNRPLCESLGIGVMALVLLLLVGVGAIDLLVLSPQWMAPGYSIEEIFAALSPADRTLGVVMIYIWIAFWSIAAFIYLVVAVVAVGSAAPSTHWMLVAGFATIAAMVFFQFWAGFSIGNSISDTLPPFTGGRHDIGALYGNVGQFALVAAIWGAIAPRRGGALRRAQGTEPGPQGTEPGPHRTEPRASGPETRPAGATYSQ